MKTKTWKKRLIAAVMVWLLVMNTPLAAKQSVGDYSKLFEAIVEKIEQDYTGDTDRQKLFEAAMRGMFDSLDVYSEFFTPEESKQFEQSINKDFEGIGVQFVKEKNQFVIVKIIKGGSAGEAGILVGDILLEADGKDLSKLESTTDVANQILGKKGTTVKVKIKRGTKILDFKLVRRKLHLPTAEQMDWQKSKQKLPVGVKPEEVLYIEISSFGEETAEEFYKILIDKKNKKAKTLILDLRDNGGGYVSSVIAIANMILPKGKVVTFKGKTGEAETYYSELEKSPFQKIIALTNKSSASASEILAGAVKDSPIGMVIGGNTFGKGVAQELVGLNVGGYNFKLTYKEFFTPKGNPIQKVGIAPNIEVAVPEFVFSDRRFFLGDEHSDIYKIEAILKYLGYLSAKPDNRYDSKTLSSVLAFQKARGLGEHKVIDFTTQAALNEALREALQKEDKILKRALEEIR